MGINKRYENLTNEEVHSIAVEKLKAIRLYDDLYIIPANITSTKEIDLNYVNDNLLSNDVKKRLRKLNIEDGDSLTLICEAEFDDIEKIIEVVNLRNEIAIEFDYNGELNHENREELINTIADSIKDREAIVSYYLPYDLKGLREIIISSNM